LLLFLLFLFFFNGIFYFVVEESGRGAKSYKYNWKSSTGNKLISNNDKNRQCTTQTKIAKNFKSCNFWINRSACKTTTTTTTTMTRTATAALAITQPTTNVSLSFIFRLDFYLRLRNHPATPKSTSSRK
jgi:hypothetical protein